MHFEYIYYAESIDYVNTYILAMLQWTKVSFATVLSTFYCYFASDAWKCINYCTHCRKLKCIHYYSCNFRLFTFCYRSDSICKAFTTYNPCWYVYRLICWYAPSIFLDNKYSYTISWRESLEKLVRYTTYRQYCVVWAMFNKLFESDIYIHIFWFQNIFIT